ncbi:ATP-binding cassette domain-containing protein [Ktedonosporobacter rubrisoli]|uniref:ATP-binding cassette domain-containing protein n=1 Tax=Ktedonosporobacter rubrisoli TaxID=2509675 RepID=A0A4P6JT77_KTERU|nr:oligopeptide/dipeptide ABC transporter ATP-binding protein [Ktedonosporobacter rubrisoli]QBD78490.1 ATP-binding cassette domain-containing protein [Ktedonosporobacter rubrisoli]
MAATLVENRTLLKVDELKMYFPQGARLAWSAASTDKPGLRRVVKYLRAVDGVSFSIERGQTLGLVGESGSGKTTIGRAIVRLYEPTAGQILFWDKDQDKELDLASLDGEKLRQVRRRVQMVFQDPYASLNPRFTIGSLIAEPMQIYNTGSKQEIHDRVLELLKVVGLRPEYADRYPHEFSGGQRQRIAVARALSINPELVIADEPVSALDVSVRAQVLNLLQRLQKQFALTYLFVSHDLSVVRHVADRIAVMYMGKIVEMADRDELYSAPLHPYTQALLSAIPIPDPQVEKKRQRIILPGDLPSPINLPTGCRFRTRCPLAQQICSEVEPSFEAKDGGSHFAACHFAQKRAS